MSSLEVNPQNSRYAKFESFDSCPNYSNVTDFDSCQKECNDNNCQIQIEKYNFYNLTAMSIFFAVLNVAKIF